MGSGGGVLPEAGYARCLWGHQVKVPSCPKQLSQPFCPYQRQHTHGMWDFGNSPLPSACTPLRLRFTYNSQKTSEDPCSTHPGLEPSVRRERHLLTVAQGTSSPGLPAGPPNKPYIAERPPCLSPPPHQQQFPSTSFVPRERVPREGQETSS